MGTKRNYTIFNHTADMGIMVTGVDLKDLFEKAGRSITEIMVRTTGVNETEPLHISLNGEDLSDLMVRWLGEILYLFDAEQKIVLGISITEVSQNHLTATLNVAPFQPDHHEIINDIKAVTYHQIEVKQTGEGWTARVIFDL